MTSPVNQRIPMTLFAVAIAAALAACPGTEGTDLLSTKAKPSPTTAAATPTPSPSPSPSPSPTDGVIPTGDKTQVGGNTETGGPSPTPEPLNTLAPSTASVLSVVLSDTQATLFLPSQEASTSADLPTTIQLSAIVHYSDSAMDTALDWTAIGEAVTVVGGLVTAHATGSAVVTASSTRDPAKQATASILVLDDGEIDVTVD